MFIIYLVRILANFVMFCLLGRKRVYGLENLPPKGSYITVSNHMSMTDSILLIISGPPIETRFWAAEKWMQHPLGGPLLRALGGIEIQRGEADRKAVRAAFAAIEAGFPFGVAPEGTRSKVGALMQAKHGGAYLATRVKVPVLPVGIVNTDKFFDNFKHLRRTTLEVHIGRPFYLPDIGRRVRQPELPAYTHYMMIHIAALLPARYHGYYADSPALKALLAGEDPWPLCWTAEGLTPPDGLGIEAGDDSAESRP